MSQYRQKSTYALGILVAATLMFLNAAINIRRGAAGVGALIAIIAVLWAVYSIWAFRMTYIRVESSGLTVRRGGLIGAGRFVAWEDVASASLDRNRLDLVTVDGDTITLRLSSLRSADREDFLRVLSAHAALS